MKRIAIVGAGIGGLTLAHALKEHFDITVFEKGRGAGGRMSTRREDKYAFDHGAQSFTVRTRAFADWLERLRHRNLVDEWRGPLVTVSHGKVLGPRQSNEPHYVAVPGMNAIAKALADGVDLKSGVDVAPITSKSGPHTLVDMEGTALGDFDLVVSASVARHARMLFPAAGKDAPFMTDVAMRPCHALMVAFDQPWTEDWIAARIIHGPLDWLSVDSTKPGRDRSVTTLVAQTKSDWSRYHVDIAAPNLAPLLYAALKASLPFDLLEPALLKAHRWGAAFTETRQRSGPWLNTTQGLAATGDWTATNRIEDICLSALALAERIKAA
ncbi:NAD(P)/FAD-dependent oxidoreductase [Georhizobium sp. MAB10]|uniref:NAD(P)/FAD-dependent oxidoreductase n=1 Tax=Georhizobium sp. MAB10 TaxID=3028319 RepID=UPI003855C347